ncbi:MAG: DUF4235 domain-containing protein [Anaerolineales bacterium]
MTRGGIEMQDQVIECASEVLERGNEVKARLTKHGKELRDRVMGTAERARDAVSQAPKDRWVKPAGSGLVVIRDRAKGVQLGSARSKVTYELVSLVSGVLGGALAAAIFNRIWQAVSDENEAPEPTALDHSIREVLLAGALQGAVFGLVKAALGRITARGYRRFTGDTR